MSIDKYCGIQESKRGWFLPLYVNNSGTCVSPKTQQELTELAKLEPRFVYDFSFRVLEGKNLWCDGMLSRKETGERLLETMLARIEYLTQKEGIETSNSFESNQFYKMIKTLSEYIDTKPYLERYENCRRDEREPLLLKYTG